MDRPTILVIDYEPRNLAATVEPLTAAGYHVEVARDGVAGLEAFRRLQPPVVFMEAMLPKKHAFEVCQEIRRGLSGRKTRVFILGAATIAQSQQSKAVHQYGADRFLARPVDGPTLVSLCNSVLPGPDAPEVPELDLLEPMPPGAAEAEREILRALESAAPSVDRLDLSAMTEDDIMAQLDQLLPSVVPTSGASPSPAARPAPAKAVAAAAPAVPPPKPASMPAPVAAAPVRQVAPVPKPASLPAPDPRPAPRAEAAAAPAPARSRLPMLAAACVLAIAAVGSFLLFKPGAAPVLEPVAEPLQAAVPSALGNAPLEGEDITAPATAPPAEQAALETTPAAPVPAAETPAVQVARLQPTPATAVPVPKAAPPKATESLGTKTTPAPEAKAADKPKAAELVDAAVKSAEIPLPLAPPRLEPLPVGSDAARPRISPDVFVRRTQAGALVDLREVDERPAATSRPAPAYPPGARQMRREGDFELRLLVDAQGNVASVEVVSGAAKSDLAAAAVRAARGWKYRPAMKDGVPVQVKIVEKIAFKL